MARHTAKSHKIRKVEILVIQMGIYGVYILTYCNTLFYRNRIPYFRYQKIIDTNYNTSGISRKFSLYQTMCIIVTFYKSSTMHKENNRQFLCLYRTK